MKSAWRLGAAAASLVLAACANVSAQRPNLADAYADHLVGRLANIQQDHAAAAARYFAALQRDPRNETLLEGAVTSSLAAGDVTRARQAARMAPNVGAPAYAQIVRAADQLQAGRWRQAADDLNRVEGGAGEELVARMMQVWARAADGRVDEVITDLSPLASIRPYGGLFTYQQAMALDYAGRNTEALTAYTSAASGGMFLPPAVERHADLLVRSDARGDALALLQQDANRANAQLEAALRRVQAGEAVDAERLTPARGAAIGLYGLAAIFLQESDSTNALATLTIAQILDPQLDAARIMFAQTQSGLGHGDLARNTLSQIGASSPYAESARVMEAWVLADQGRADEALALARSNAASGDPRALRALADMYRNQRRFDEAEPLYSQLVAAQPQDWRLFFARGAARERLGRWPEAEADMRRALELSPDQPDVLNYLGYSWVDRGEHMEEGLTMIRRAAELRPMSGAVMDSLGWAYFRMGDFEQAQRYLERAVELEPADATLNDHLGDVYWRIGRRIEARFQWQRALTFQPTDVAAIQAKIDNGLPPLPRTRAATR